MRAKFALISIVAVTASTKKAFSPSLLGSGENVLSGLNRCQILCKVSPSTSIFRSAHRGGCGLGASVGKCGAELRGMDGHSMAGPRMSARSRAFGDGIGILRVPVLPMSRELILLMCVSVVFMPVNSLILRC